MLSRVRYWTGRRAGQADGVGTITQGPDFRLGLRWWYVHKDDGSYSEWLTEAHIEAELPNGAGVKPRDTHTYLEAVSS